MTGHTTTLTIGGMAKTFFQSDRMFAVRPRPGQQQALALALRRLSAGLDADVIGEQAGYMLIELSSPPPHGMDALLADLSDEPEVLALTAVYEIEEEKIAPNGQGRMTRRGPLVPDGKIFLRFDAGAAPSQREAVIDDYKLDLVRAHDSRSQFVSAAGVLRDTVVLCEKLSREAAVETAEPQFAVNISPAQITVPDKRFDLQWHLRNTGENGGDPFRLKEGADARVVDAWEALGGFGSQDVVVAVIDQGIDINHPDLNEPGKIVAPFDFENRTEDPRPKSGSDNHGTPCAGLAVGSVGRGEIIGVAPKARLMPLRYTGKFAESDIAEWFEYAWRNGADVISCSWEPPYATWPLGTAGLEAIAEAATKGRGGKGCVVVFASGNKSYDISNADGTHVGPNGERRATFNMLANHPNVIAVSAMTSKDKWGDYSNYGKDVWVCAPGGGAGFTALLPTADVRDGADADNKRIELGYDSGAYTEFSGTSAACPIVAGVCALVLSANPNLRAQEVKDILRMTARKIGDASEYDADGHSIKFGWGCVNAGDAVREALRRAGRSPATGVRVMAGLAGAAATAAAAGSGAGSGAQAPGRAPTGAPGSAPSPAPIPIETEDDGGGLAPAPAPAPAPQAGGQTGGETGGAPVLAPAPETPPPTDLAVSPNQKATAKAIVSIFETGSVTGRYDQVTLVAGDRGGLSYGTHQATLRNDGAFPAVFARYLETARDTYAARQLRPYADRVKRRDTSLEQDRFFMGLLSAAADEKEMRDAQDAMFDELYWERAIAETTARGFVYPLSAAVIFDSLVHGSFARIAGRVPGSLKQDEKAWISRYIDLRASWLVNHSNLLLQRTVYRMEAFRKLIEQDAWFLELPLMVRGQTIDLMSLTQLPRGVFSGPPAGSRVLRLQQPLMSGADVRLVQAALRQDGVRIITTVDGFYGRGTLAAVIAAQEKLGLAADGAVGPATFAALGLTGATG